MNNLDKQYQDLLTDILENGVRKGDRTGTGTISVFGRTIRHKMSEGFPLLTTKKMYTRGVIAELLWFLRGETNIQQLIAVECNIWNGDAYKRYRQHMNNPDWINHFVEPGTFRDNALANIGNNGFTTDEFVEEIKTDDNFAKDWGDLGPIYGKQWRDFQGADGSSIDQIQDLINTLFKNPDSRRMLVNAWNPTEVDKCVLPPCHYGFQIYTRDLILEERIKVAYQSNALQPGFDDGFDSDDDTYVVLDQHNVPKRAISLAWNQRSVDTFLGLPFNIASYGLLLCILGEISNMVPDELVGFLGDTHLYTNHLEQAKLQISRIPYGLPTLAINPEFWAPGTEDGCGMGAGTYERNFDSLAKSLTASDFEVIGYVSHPTIKAPLSN